MKILVIDDEALARDMIIDGLISLDYSDIAQAENGIQALEIIKEQRPDIVIADVRMPGMDGIELLSKVKDSGVDIIFIFVSGYDLFEYAQKAVKLGAFSYLLKPVKTTELAEVMEQASKKLEYQNKQLESDTLIKIKARQGIEIMKRHFLNELVTQKSISKNYKSKKLLELGLELNLDTFCVMVLCPDGWDPDEKSRPLNDKELIKFSIENILSEILSNNNLSPYIFDIDEEIGVILNFSSGSISIKEICNICSEIKDCVNKYLHYQVTLGIGKTVKSIEDTGSSLETARKAVSQRLIKGINQVFCYEDMDSSKEGTVSISFGMEQDILSCFERCDIHSATKAQESLYSPFRNFDIINTDNLRKLNLQLILLFYKILNQMNINPEETLGDEFMLYNEVNSYKNIDSMSKWFEEKLKVCFKAIGSEKDKGGRRIIEKSKEFINSNLGNDITLESVAEYVHLSPNYFSKLFKQETGKNFVDFVTGCRIGKAKQLLKEDCLKANEVAKLVGFNDTKHFYKVFKKHTGLTPSEYKDI